MLPFLFPTSKTGRGCCRFMPLCLLPRTVCRPLTREPTQRFAGAHSRSIHYRYDTARPTANERDDITAGYDNDDDARLN
ncbi:hypothetical protein BDU57DRAFT_515832 [Ampelomyces quisqualis]|uniref:Uncharacterized protein n=1 Tax=Ampelomyces quisqualis TaxID=50730 RepID=A0A6A5QKP6_AMPQU|nr:hypothetical protein BDU57DRAFT_515832 [Ampelomyces quisqualis]